MSASAAQIAANRENAKKSTGPNTPEGKAISSRNSAGRGLLGRVAVLSEAEAKVFSVLGLLFVTDLKPVGAFEESLVESLVDNHWQLRRVRARLEELTSDFEEEISVAAEKLVRYEKRLEASIGKIEATFRKRQKFRKAEEHYETIILFEDHNETPYKPSVHGHLPRIFGFVPEENTLYKFFHAMTRHDEPEPEEKVAETAPEPVENPEPPPATEAVIG